MGMNPVTSKLHFRCLLQVVHKAERRLVIAITASSSPSANTFSLLAS